MNKRLRTLLCLAILAAAGAPAQAAAEGRVIVQYRAQATVLKQTQSADRGRRMTDRLGTALVTGRQIDNRTEVLRSTEMSSEKLAELLAAQPDVEYAVPDRRRHPHALPDDPLFPGQWYLQSNEISAIRADLAWLSNTGSPGIVLAFVDSGVRYDHPDLSAKLLPGYDFIKDIDNSGDGDGVDSDASDPGDYTTANECEDGEPATSSSWHGTRVAGILGAASNNAAGIAGANWGSKLLPVRALGKCGGYDSDIIAGMRWAAGLSVLGVPNNPEPAKVINLSLGGEGTCGRAYKSAINELADRKVLVVASAGNESSPVSVPANCPGVLAVAGVRHIGSKVGLSNFGPEVSVSAPAGNCVNLSGACLYSIDTTTNTGTTDPVLGEAGGSYTDQSNASFGTSFSAPMVSATAALMLSVNPDLDPDLLIARIKSSARPFPSYPDLNNCPTDPTLLADECNCTTSTCGAGLLDAGEAVRVAADAISSGGSSGVGDLDIYSLLLLTGLSALSYRLRLGKAS